MSITFNISGMKQAQKELNKYVSKKTKELVDETNKAALNVERGAKKRANVDTGRMRSSIHIIPVNSTDTQFSYTDNEGNSFDGATGESTEKEEAAVVTSVDYAPKQEAISPFMVPAWEKVRVDYIKNLKKILRAM